MKSTALYKACRGRDKMQAQERFQQMPYKIIRIRKDGSPYANEVFNEWNSYATREEAEKRIEILRQLNPHQTYELKF